MIFELNYKDHAEELRSRGHATDNIKDPHLMKYCMLMFSDDTDTIMLQVNRYNYPKMADIVWRAYNNKLPVCIKGNKIRGWRIVSVKSMRVL